MRAEGHQFFDSYPMLSAGCSIPGCLKPLYSQDGKDRFFPAEQDKVSLKILPHIQTGQTAILKEGRSWLKKKRPLKSQLMKKTPQQSLWTGQSLQREQGEKQKHRAGQTPHTKNHSSLVRVPFASYKPHQSRRLSLQADGSAFHSPAEMVLQENLRRHSTTS